MKCEAWAIVKLIRDLPVPGQFMLAARSDRIHKAWQRGFRGET